jgi:hypothetical protein
MTTDRAELPSWARTIVNESVACAVTRTISALVESGCAPAGQIVALKGTAGKRAPSPEATTSDVPEVAGDGAVATVEYAKFL